MTAAELQAILDADPAYRAAMEAEDTERDERAAAWSEAEQPILADLRSAGYDIGSVWDLVNTSEPYTEALPILVRHLQLDYPDRVREGIARALAVPPASYAWDSLVQVFRSNIGPDTRMGLAAALAVACPDERLTELLELARDERLGDSRFLLLRTFKRKRSARSRLLLHSLRNDPFLGEEIRRMYPQERSRPT